MFRKKLIFSAAFISILFFGMAITTLGSIVPELKEKFQLNDVSLGVLFTILPLGILLGSLLFGPICDRFGYKILLAAACFSMFIGFEGIAFASSKSILNFCIFLFGFGGGIINGATSALISDISEQRKGANLSILGVFFGLGALSMPLILGFLEKIFSYEMIVAVVGAATFIIGIFYLLISFPPPKQSDHYPIKKSLSLLKDPILLLVSFFLFFQSAFEGIINNWTPTFLTSEYAIPQKNALIALSISVVGMVIMRILLGSIFRNMQLKSIWIISFAALFLGLILLAQGNQFLFFTTGLFLIGAGLAAGFPIMLGLLGQRFQGLSGTAFSLAFTIALAGNMIINYAMGIIAHNYGIHHLITVGFAELLIMMVLCYFIVRKAKVEKA
jgi:MFS family permease